MSSPSTLVFVCVRVSYDSWWKVSSDAEWESRTQCSVFTSGFRSVCTGSALKMKQKQLEHWQFFINLPLTVKGHKCWHVFKNKLLKHNCLRMLCSLESKIYLIKVWILKYLFQFQWKGKHKYTIYIVIVCILCHNETQEHWCSTVVQGKLKNCWICFYILLSSRLAYVSVSASVHTYAETFRL